MILKSMADEEIMRELQHDYRVIRRRYLERYCNAYDKLRRKNPRLKREELPKSYAFETPSKNQWIMILSKPPADTKYNSLGSISICLLCYYYTEVSIRVFKVDPTNGIGAFNGHFFARYNERMNLGLTKPIDKVIHYFSHNSYCIDKLSLDQVGYRVLGKCRDGFRLGNVKEGDYWIVYKTFISNDLSNKEQDEIGEDLMNELLETIEEIISSDEFNRNDYFYKTDVYKGICGSEKQAS